jgi:hypothetical protein
MVLDAMEDGCVTQVDSLMNEGLADDKVGGVVTILGGKGSLIYHGKAWVGLANDVLLD